MNGCIDSISSRVVDIARTIIDPSVSLSTFYSKRKKMTKIFKFREDMLGWKRQPGPLRVWRVIDGKKKTADGKTLRFSIEEVPEDRYEEVMDLMCTIFVKDEPTCHHLNFIDDEVSMEDFRKLWSFCLQQRITVGAFWIDENNPRPPLVGVNMVWVKCEASERALQSEIEVRGESIITILRVLRDIQLEKNTKNVYNVDKFITAYGLCVHPDYRGQGIGYHLLDTRKDMSKAYDIQVTTTVFTSSFAQTVAAKVGFKLLSERNYVDIRNENGDEIFPGILHRSMKFMGMRFNN